MKLRHCHRGFKEMINHQGTLSSLRAGCGIPRTYPTWLPNPLLSCCSSLARFPHNSLPSRERRCSVQGVKLPEAWYWHRQAYGSFSGSSKVASVNWMRSRLPHWIWDHNRCVNGVRYHLGYSRGAFMAFAAAKGWRCHCSCPIGP